MDRFTKEEEEYIKYAFKPNDLHDEGEPYIPTPYDPSGKLSLQKFQENILDGEIKALKKEEEKKRKKTIIGPDPKRSRKNMNENMNENENVTIDNLLELDENDFNGGKKYKYKKSKKTHKSKKSKKSKKYTKKSKKYTKKRGIRSKK